MGDRVVGIAVGDAKLHRHPAVLGGSEDEQQLLEVRTVILEKPNTILAGRCPRTISGCTRY
jgi:hypothetical protein